MISGDAEFVEEIEAWEELEREDSGVCGTSSFSIILLPRL
jgi:hypothetical protein